MVEKSLLFNKKLRSRGDILNGCKKIDCLVWFSRLGGLLGIGWRVLIVSNARIAEQKGSQIDAGLNRCNSVSSSAKYERTFLRGLTVLVAGRR